MESARSCPIETALLNTVLNLSRARACPIAQSPPLHCTTKVVARGFQPTPSDLSSERVEAARSCPTKTALLVPAAGECGRAYDQWFVVVLTMTSASH